MGGASRRVLLDVASGMPDTPANGRYEGRFPTLEGIAGLFNPCGYDPGVVDEARSLNVASRDIQTTWLFCSIVHDVTFRTPHSEVTQ
jgi:hypothetical protein